jgi:hypothetical protein
MLAFRGDRTPKRCSIGSVLDPTAVFRDDLLVVVQGKLPQPPTVGS